MENNYLNSGKSQSECTKFIIEELELIVDHFLYHIRRYHVPITLALIYTKVDIKDELITHKRLSDIESCIKLPCGYFNFIFLPFTDSIGTHSFLKSLEKDFLNKHLHYSHYEELQHENHNTYNFINSYLFSIAEQVTCKGDLACNLPKG
ncbi:MAG: hypothetical protein RBR59_06590 [Sulfurimonadaceae bacterium]|jgi:hypothetical protein|nr:hypothetical protein [Sulfurimonadaceae bacterium]